MTFKNDLVGKRFGRLLVTAFAGMLRGPTSIRGWSTWQCLCDCGTTLLVRRGSLTSGNTKSCGCFKAEHNPNLRHGEYRGGPASPELRTWKEMRGRCTNKNRKDFSYYGGRGIKICSRWKSFVNFLADMGRKKDPKLTLERINSNGYYTPTNCRWATRRRHASNRISATLTRVDRATATVD